MLYPVPFCGGHVTSLLRASRNRKSRTFPRDGQASGMGDEVALAADCLSIAAMRRPPSLAARRRCCHAEQSIQTDEGSTAEPPPTPVTPCPLPLRPDRRLTPVAASPNAVESMATARAVNSRGVTRAVWSRLTDWTNVVQSLIDVNGHY